MIKEGFCKHFRGLMKDTCDKGIRYDSFTDGERPGIFKRIPCVEESAVCGCDKIEYPTANELKESEKLIEIRLNGMVAAMSAIKDKHKVETEWETPTGKNRSAVGTIECPVCKSALRYSVSGYNGHIWGKCTTDGCLSWMQ